MRKGTCIYFNGTVKENCEQGIAYKDVMKNRLLDIPCFSKTGFVCEKYKEPTDEQLKEQENKRNKSFKGMCEAIKLIKETKKQHGTINCPVCGKKLGFTVSGYNGHIHGQCESDNCLAWMM
jgi:hypothetical protein